MVQGVFNVGAVDRTLRLCLDIYQSSQLCGSVRFIHYRGFLDWENKAIL